MQPIMENVSITGMFEMVQRKTWLFSDKFLQYLAI